jgi:hypothetical protein
MTLYCTDGTIKKIPIETPDRLEKPTQLRDNFRLLSHAYGLQSYKYTSSSSFFFPSSPLNIEKKKRDTGKRILVNLATKELTTIDTEQQVVAWYFLSGISFFRSFE